MGTTVYYFTGTGNSLAIARELAERLPAQLIPMQTVVEEAEVKSDSDAIGIVFPVYNHRIPYIVKRLADRLPSLNGKYVFAVCTYGDSPAISLEYVARLIQERGGRLSAGYGVKMPYNYVIPSKGLSGVFRPFILRETSGEEQKCLLESATRRLDTICETLLNREQGPVEAEYQGIEHAIDFFGLRDSLQKSVWLKVAGYKGKTSLCQMESVQLMDCGFHSDEQCSKCGTCVKICPVGNIHMTDSGPQWRHQCEQCFACLQWCPKQALQFGEGTIGYQRYHHPDITLTDLLRDTP